MYVLLYVAVFIIIFIIFLSKNKQTKNLALKTKAAPSQSRASSRRFWLFVPQQAVNVFNTNAASAVLRGQTAAQSLHGGVCWQPLEPLSYFSACSATSHPTLYHTSALCCCSVHGFNSLVAFQRCPSHIQHRRFNPHHPHQQSSQRTRLKSL